MADQHSIHVASQIRRGLPVDVLRSTTSLTINVVGEQTETGKFGVKIAKLGYVEVRGEVINTQMHIKLDRALKANLGQRQLKNLTTVRRS